MLNFRSSNAFDLPGNVNNIPSYYNLRNERMHAAWMKAGRPCDDIGENQNTLRAVRHRQTRSAFLGKLHVCFNLLYRRLARLETSRERLQIWELPLTLNS